MRLMKVFQEARIREALVELQKEEKLPAGALPPVVVEHPKDDSFGEYTTNIALLLAKRAGKKPLAIAEMLKAKISGGNIEKVKVAPPRYPNFFFSLLPPPTPSFLL